MSASVFFIIAAILMVLGSLPIPNVPVDLWKLGWAFVIIGYFIH